MIYASTCSQSDASQAPQHPGGEEHREGHHHFSGHYDLFRKNPNAQAQLRAPIFEDKVVDLIVEKAKVKDTKVSKDDLMKDDDLPAGYGS